MRVRTLHAGVGGGTRVAAQYARDVPSKRAPESSSARHAGAYSSSRARGSSTCCAMPDHGAVPPPHGETPYQPHEVAQLAGRKAAPVELSISDESTSIADRIGVPNDALVIGLTAVTAVTLVGSYVTGSLARKRRLELAHVNSKLRSVRPALMRCRNGVSYPALRTSEPPERSCARLQVVHELRKRQEEEQQALVCEASPDEANTAYQLALQNSMHKADKEHPPSAVGVDGLSVQSARRKVRGAHAHMIWCGRNMLLRLTGIRTSQNNHREGRRCSCIARIPVAPPVGEGYSHRQRVSRAGVY